MFHTIFEAEQCTALFTWESLLVLFALIPCFFLASAPIEAIKKNGLAILVKEKKLILLFVAALIFLLIVLTVISEDVSENLALRENYDRYESGECAYVEGVIADFHPMPEELHDVESFTVDGIYFAYGAHNSPYYYSHCQKDGGLLKEGQEVRIWYFPDDLGNTIMRIDVKGA